MLTNRYLRLYNFDRIPPHILTDKNTLCLRYYPEFRTCLRVYPSRSFAYIAHHSIVLIEPNSEDLSYLTLLGIAHCPVFLETEIRRYNEIDRTGSARI